MRHGARMSLRRRAPVRLLPFAAAVAAVAAVAACSGRADDDTALARAASFQQALKAELMAAMAAGGPVNAVKVCSERAPAIAEEASKDGYSVRRIGTRVRNLANTPSTADQQALAELAAKPDARFVRGDGDDVVRARRYVPLRIEAACLNCHGKPDGMQSELLQALATRYPDDKATGYALGDLRGAIVVETRH